MEDIYSWYERVKLPDKPFLVMGKGPSFEFLNQYDLSGYHTISLNHVIRDQAAMIAHMIDIDVVESCAEVLEANAQFVLMPEYPHIDSKPSTLSLKHFVQTIPVLERLDRRNRLLWYPLWSARMPSPLPVVEGTFSGSVVVNLLGKLGVKQIRTIGIDGGTEYGAAFLDLKDVTLFKNEHQSFDVQFVEMAGTAEDYQVEVKPLVSPIRVFIGSDPYQTIAARTLEHSIRKFTTHPVQCFHMVGLPLRRPRNPANRMGTGFSFYRFLIPELAGYRGRAIYLDADMLVFADIAELWNLPMDGNSVLCSAQSETPHGWEDGRNNSLGEERHWTPGRQLSVMLLDCSALDWDVDRIIDGLDRGDYTYKDLMAELCIVDENLIGDTIPNSWNCLEWYEAGESRLTHFTVVPTQPWRHENNQLNDLWEEAFVDALQAGAFTIDEVRSAADAGYLKPSLVSLVQKHEATVTPVVANPPEPTEEERLRHLLWQSMIKANQQALELDEIYTYPTFWLERWLIRKPIKFALRVLRWLIRKLQI